MSERPSPSSPSAVYDELPRSGRGRRAFAAAVRDIATRTARDVVAAQRRLRPADVREKAIGDFVTTVDLRAERRLRRELRRLLPAAGWLGEETAAAGLDREWVWVVDPIDGTSNFARGLPHFAVSIALLEAGDPVVAALHCLPEDAPYVAVRGAGAWRAGRRLRAPERRLDAGSIIGCQWLRGQQELTFLAALQRRGSRIRTLGSTVTQLADVAVGRFDANVQEQGRLWDIAAAGLVVAEAGARFTDWSGAPIFPLGDLTEAREAHFPSIGAAPGVHAALLRLIRPRRK